MPPELIEFHLWYLKEKGWMKRTENGTLEITVAGVDHVNAEFQRELTSGLQIEPPRA